MKVHDPQLAKALGPVARQLAERAHAGDLPMGRVHVAVSGGADSVLLVCMLCRLARRHQLKLSVGHIDHGLRKASAQEARWVKGLAQDLGLAVQIHRLDLAPGPNLASRARDARRQILREQAKAQRAEVIALAHTATDQAETLLLHASRGAGLAGLGGMRAFRAPFWRPLLHLSRAQTRDLALRCTPGFVQDPSNERLASPRVRVRAQVLVALRELNPQMDAAFVRVAQQAQEAEDALGQWADRELLGRRIGPGCHDLAGLDQLPIAVALRVVRAMCGHEGIELSALDHETLRKICEAARLRAALAQGRCEAPVGGLGPVRFDLHPFGHLTVRSTKLTVFIAPASRATHGKSSSL